MANNQVILGVGANTSSFEREVAKATQRVQNQVSKGQFRLQLDDKGFRQPLGRISADLNQFQNAMDASIARTLAFGASVSAIGGLVAAFKNLVSVTVDVEKSLVDINVLFGISEKQLQGFASSLFDVAKNTATSFATVAEAAAEFSRQGLSVAETTKRVNDALILTRLSGLDAAKSVETLTAAINGFSKEAITSSDVVNRLANVDAAFAISSADLAGALSRAGAVAQDAKVSFNELLAATTAVQQATARGGNVIGNGFKTIFTRLQRSSVLEELENIGVATKTSTGNIRGAIDILRDYARVYQTLGDEQRAFTAEQVAGVFQINTLKALVNDLTNDYGVYNSALGIANETTNQATQRNEELNKTLSAVASQTATSFEQLANSIGSVAFEDNFKGILGLFKGLAEEINGVLSGDSFGEVGAVIGNGLVKGLGDFLTGPGAAVALIGITKLIKFITKETKTAIRQVFEIGGETQRRAQIQEKINQLLREDNNLLNEVERNAGDVTKVMDLIESKIIQQNVALETQKRIQREILQEGINRGLGFDKQERLTRTTSTRTNSVAGSVLGAAGGFIPNMVAKEKGSISRGVGGAKSGDKPVIIPNFDFGGGKKGTMVAHTGEHIVPNFANGGSAVFNRDMVKSSGLPSGAKKINAAGGFVPNFAAVSIKKYLEKNKIEGGTEQEIINNITNLRKEGVLSSGRVGGLGTVKIGGFEFAGSVIDNATKGKVTKKKSGQSTEAFVKTPYLGVAAALGGKNKGFARESVSSMKATAQKGLASYYKGEQNIPFKSLQMNEIQIRSLKNVDGNDFDQGEFRKQFADSFTDPLLGFASKIFGGAFPDPKESQDISKKIKGLGTNAKLFNAQTEGYIFEAAIQAATKGAGQAATFFSKEDKNPYFDFEEKGRGSASQRFQDIFGFEGIMKADAKRTASQPNINSLVSKAMSDPDVRKMVLGGIPAKSAANGFIPSFANMPSRGVKARVERTPEGRRAMATERALTGSARMGFDSRVGFGVYNDGQKTLKNAVNQHLNRGDSVSSLPSMGRDAQGAAGGFLPNYALRLKQTTGQRSKSGRPEDLNATMKDSVTTSKKGLSIEQDILKAAKEGNVLNRVLNASFAASLAAGVIQTGSEKSESYNTQNLGRLAGGLTQGAGTGASLGSFAGPWGAAIGGTVGAIVGMVGPIKDLVDPIKRLSYEFDRASELLKKDSANLARAGEIIASLNSDGVSRSEKKELRKELNAITSVSIKEKEEIKEAFKKGGNEGLSRDLKTKSFEIEKKQDVLDTINSYDKKRKTLEVQKRDRVLDQKGATGAIGGALSGSILGIGGIIAGAIIGGTGNTGKALSKTGVISNYEDEEARRKTRENLIQSVFDQSKGQGARLAATQGKRVLSEVGGAGFTVESARKSTEDALKREVGEEAFTDMKKKIGKDYEEYLDLFAEGLYGAALGDKQAEEIKRASEAAAKKTAEAAKESAKKLADGISKSFIDGLLISRRASENAFRRKIGTLADLQAEGLTKGQKRGVNYKSNVAGIIEKSGSDGRGGVFGQKVVVGTSEKAAIANLLGELQKKQASTDTKAGERKFIKEAVDSIKTYGKAGLDRVIGGGGFDKNNEIGKLLIKEGSAIDSIRVNGIRQIELARLQNVIAQKQESVLEQIAANKVDRDILSGAFDVKALRQEIAKNADRSASGVSGVDAQRERELFSQGRVNSISSRGVVAGSAQDRIAAATLERSILEKVKTLVGSTPAVERADKALQRREGVAGKAKFIQDLTGFQFGSKQLGSEEDLKNQFLPKATARLGQLKRSGDEKGFKELKDQMKVVLMVLERGSKAKSELAENTQALNDLTEVLKVKAEYSNIGQKVRDNERIGGLSSDERDEKRWKYILRDYEKTESVEERLAK
tara:strand:+ start:42603 stop:48266 length:5664 start_codon:yes stop_codon:yes gene_type:complete